MASGSVNGGFMEPFYLDNSYADKWQEVGQTVTDSAPYTCPADGLYVLYLESSTSAASRWQLSPPDGTNQANERIFQNKNPNMVTDSFYLKKGTVLYARGASSSIVFTVKGYYPAN